MKNLTAAVVFGVLLFIVLSCGLVDRFAGGPEMTKTNDLWSDVPRMDGLTHSDLDLPFGAKLLIRTALNNMWRFNKEGEDKTPVTGDWVAFASSGTPADVQKFYTLDRMSSFGNWDNSKESTCLDGKDKGMDGGLICVFHKIADKKEVMLAIFVMQDDSSKKTDLFYLRLERDIPANATKPSNKRPPV